MSNHDRAAAGGRNAKPKNMLHRPAEVAKMLRCSEWWVKEQARRRRIPFSWIGGSYLFTDEHVAEIIRLFENRPNRPELASPDTSRGNRGASRHTSPAKVRLTARTPRRARRHDRPEAA